MKKPKLQKAIPPAPAPDLEAAQKAKDISAAEDMERRRLKGRASTLLTSGLGDTSSASLASRTLLGS